MCIRDSLFILSGAKIMFQPLHDLYCCSLSSVPLQIRLFFVFILILFATCKVFCLLLDVFTIGNFFMYNCMLTVFLYFNCSWFYSRLFTPVSYTHLDVYKRQICYYPSIYFVLLIHVHVVSFIKQNSSCRKLKGILKT